MTKYKVTVDEQGTRCWYNESNQLHRVDGPAIESADGTKSWYLNGKCHREDGPAIEYANGNKYWYLNHKCHRIDGPAVECANGTKFWYLNGVELTEIEFLNKTKKASCEGKMVEIDGVKYKLVKA